MFMFWFLRWNLCIYSIYGVVELGERLGLCSWSSHMVRLCWKISNPRHWI